MNLTLVGGTIIAAFVELDGIRIGNGVLVHRGVLARDGTLAGFALACDHGGIRREDEGREGLLGLFDLGR